MTQRLRFLTCALVLAASGCASSSPVVHGVVRTMPGACGAPADAILGDGPLLGDAKVRLRCPSGTGLADIARSTADPGGHVRFELASPLPQGCSLEFEATGHHARAIAVDEACSERSEGGACQRVSFTARLLPTSPIPTHGAGDDAGDDEAPADPPSGDDKPREGVSQ